ncbi:MAG: CBS domain-containing protein [Geminicoccaceae bacterium]
MVAALAEQGAGVLAVDLRVSDLMTERVITCRPEDQVKTVMAEMTRRRVRHLPVVEGSRPWASSASATSSSRGSRRWSWRRWSCASIHRRH